MKQYNNDVCVCQSHKKTQNHHLFKRKTRQFWHNQCKDKIAIYYKVNGVLKKRFIPIDTYVKVCPECHKKEHPENIGFYLNALVVKELEK